jgi:hypothetical protein
MLFLVFSFWNCSLFVRQFNLGLRNFAIFYYDYSFRTPAFSLSPPLPPTPTPLLAKPKSKHQSSIVLDWVQNELKIQQRREK